MVRPKNAPWAIPDWAWAIRAWQKAGRKDKRPGFAPKRLPAWYWAWNLWRNWADKHPNSKDAHPKPPPPPPEDPALKKVRDLLDVCRKFSGRYIYGGGHGQSLSALRYDQGLDCSSSVSLALSKVGMYWGSYAQVSTLFESYGVAGRGKYLTVHANSDHVWLEFSLPEGYLRFDTSPHGCGDMSGPRVRSCPRNAGTFVERHLSGL
jgi:hypothetical protein